VATLARLRVQPADPTTASDLAAAVGLSPSRFRHLFVQEVGTTYRRFVLWLRLYAAMRRLGDARTLTEAAHDAGFADSAHLSRSFRRMFGIAPSAVGRNVRLAVSDASRDSRELVAPVRV
jgi:AraC-like DNA-binding protein